MAWTSVLKKIPGVDIAFSAADAAQRRSALNNAQKALTRGNTQALGAQREGYERAQAELGSGRTNARTDVLSGQQQAFDQATGAFGDISARNQPAIDTGNRALTSLGSMANGDFSKMGRDVNFEFDPSKVQQDPGFQFRMDEAMKALSRSAAGRGQLNAGGTSKQLLQYGQGLASQEYGNAFKRAFDVAGANYEAAIGNRQNDYNRFNTQWNANMGLANMGQQAVGAQNQAQQNYYNYTGNNAINTFNRLAGNEFNYGGSMADMSLRDAAIRGGLYQNQGNIDATRAIAGANNVSGFLGDVRSQYPSLMSMGGGGYDSRYLNMDKYGNIAPMSSAPMPIGGLR